MPARPGRVARVQGWVRVVLDGELDGLPGRRHLGAGAHLGHPAAQDGQSAHLAE
ncbi:hypothetical protein AB0D34_33135 [Streptomyces sp. NPDC048420]|uniref:hypothetical protein n=1 Tax=Streptomyces sp. NPDC048420 TaxID=3155755 RepID=UPI0034222358